jgi:hypothetical protein
MLLSIAVIYILYLHNQNLPPTVRPRVKPSGPAGQAWPPKFGDKQRLPDINGGVTEVANIIGGADNEEHNAAIEEEQDKQHVAEKDVDFDGGDSNNAVENRVEDAAAEKPGKRDEPLAAGNLAAVIKDNAVDDEGEEPAGKKTIADLPPADGSIIFGGPQVNIRLSW